MSPERAAETLLLPCNQAAQPQAYTPGRKKDAEKRLVS